jgi:hypothetical protein
MRFRVRVRNRSPVPEDTVVGWLYRPGEDEDDDSPPAPGSDETQEIVPPESEREPPDAASLSTAAPTNGSDLKLLKIDRRGVLLEFSLRRLGDPAFRTALPRRCLRCGGRSHLHVRAVPFREEDPDELPLRRPQEEPGPSLPAERVRGLSPEQLLSYLPRNPLLPPPADLPMPYWMCDLCPPAGQILGSLVPDAQSGKRRGRLLIANPWRAREFLLAVGGRGTSAGRTLIDRLARLRQCPWDRLSETVRHRLEQWYHARRNERFLAYVPDRDRSRTEEGMAGLVVSDRRLVFHSNLRHRELAAGEPVQFRLAGSGDARILAVRAADWQIKRLRVDESGLNALRQALARGGHKAVWG